MLPKEFGRREMDITAARQDHQRIISRLMNGPSDSEGAMHRAEVQFGLPFWAQWNLRHKNRATPSFMAQIKATLNAVIEQSVRRDVEFLKKERAKDAARTDLKNLLAEAEDLLAQIEAAKERMK